MKYLAVNCGYSGDVNSVIGCTSAELAFSYDASWYTKNKGDKYGKQTELQLYNCNQHHLRILNNTIPAGVDYGVVCFAFENNDKAGLFDTLMKLEQCQYKSATIVEID